MPVRHLFTHLSEFAIQDKDNRYSYINVVYNVTLDEIPGALISLFINVGFTGGEGSTYRIAVEDPNKKEVFRSHDQTVRVPTDELVRSKMRIVNNVGVILKPAVFHSEGTYYVVLRVGGKVIHREPFPVIKIAQSNRGKKDAGGKKPNAGAGPVRDEKLFRKTS
jgi:hypothetical protein